MALQVVDRRLRVAGSQVVGRVPVAVAARDHVARLARPQPAAVFHLGAALGVAEHLGQDVAVPECVI